MAQQLDYIDFEVFIIKRLKLHIPNEIFSSKSEFFADLDEEPVIERLS